LRRHKLIAAAPHALLHVEQALGLMLLLGARPPVVLDVALLVLVVDLERVDVGVRALERALQPLIGSKWHACVAVPHVAASPHTQRSGCGSMTTTRRDT
jgi:hypothetical protein